MEKLKQLSNISIFGTSSDAGKSTITFLLGKILQEYGYKVVPFKAQNVSNNSRVCDDSSEISIAQYFQADILKVATSYHLNPVLLKSSKNSSSTMILKGKPYKNKNIKKYYKDIDTLKPIIQESFEYLDKRYDCVIAEGAGSPVELNLMDKDLSNIFVASQYNTKIILVADIQKGGVFASIWGVYNLLPQQLQQNIIGVIINKFQGDMSLFDDGVKIIEEQFKIPVFGVLPYLPLNLGFEDSASLKNFVQNKTNIKQTIAVIAYPYISNYNDFEPLVIDDEVFVEFVYTNQDLSRYDLIILPGSKLIFEDLKWLKKTQIFDNLLTTSQPILGICGGYEMMFCNIIDNNCVESHQPIVMQGLGFVDDDIIFQKEKILKKGNYKIFNSVVNGFEIHHGISKKYPLWYQKDNIKGTFVHGIFEDKKYYNKKDKIINNFVNNMKQHLKIDKILSQIKIQ